MHALFKVVGRDLTIQDHVPTPQPYLKRFSGCVHLVAPLRSTHFPYWWISSSMNIGRASFLGMACEHCWVGMGGWTILWEKQETGLRMEANTDTWVLGEVIELPFSSSWYRPSYYKINPFSSLFLLVELDLLLIVAESIPTDKVTLTHCIKMATTYQVVTDFIFNWTAIAFTEQMKRLNIRESTQLSPDPYMCVSWEPPWYID